MSYTVTRADRKGKKYMVVVGGRPIYFGDSRYQDYTTHHDAGRKCMYLKRAGENPTDITSARFWSRWLLWNRQSVRESAADMNRRFGIKVMVR